MEIVKMIVHAVLLGTTRDLGLCLVTANLRTKILDFRGFDLIIILILRVWNSHVQREFPAKFAATNLRLDDLSRGELGVKPPFAEVSRMYIYIYIYTHVCISLSLYIYIYVY